MKRRSRTGGEPIKGRRRKTPEPKRRNTPKAAARSHSPPTGKPEEFAQLARELREALEQQMATADVLKAISQSAFNLQIVLDTVVQSAARLCQAEMASLLRPQGSVFQQMASYRVPEELNKFMETHPVPLGRGTITGRTIIEGKPVQVQDALADPEFTFIQSVKIGGMRTMLGVPLLRDGSPVGVIVLCRRAVLPFSDKQVELVKTFAAQAVIAIENARLLNELRQRTTDLTEALEQQTATSEVLRIISSSPSELDPLFQTMLTNAARLCQANFGTLTLNERDTFRVVALYNVPEAFAELRRRQPTVRFSPKHPLAQQIATKRVLHIADVKTETAYVEGDPSFVRFVDLAGPRTLLNVPMLKDNEVIGTIGIYRKEVRPFTDKQIELLQNFAAQAVIAIENARLLNELRQRTSDLTERTTDLTEALEQQTATSEVLQVISSSPGDLQPVFATMLANMVRVCNATLGSVYRFDGDAFRFIAQHNTLPAHAERIRYSPFRPGPKHYFARMIATKSVDQVADLAAEQGYLERRPEYVTAVELGRTRTALFVPMLKENMPVAKVRMTLKITKEPVSLETPFGDEGDSRLGDLIEDQNTILPIDAAIQSNLRDITSRVLASLTPREERIVRMRFGIGINSDHTLEQVGRQFSVTRERIRQIEAKALRKLKHPSRSGMLRSFLK